MKRNLSIILWTNSLFTSSLDVSYNPDFIFGGRPVCVVSVNQYFRLNNRSSRHRLTKDYSENLTG